MEIWQTYGMLEPFDALGGARMVGLVSGTQIDPLFLFLLMLLTGDI